MRSPRHLLTTLWCGRVLGWFSLLLCVTGLTACAGMPSTERSVPAAKITAGPGQEFFALSGRLSVRDGQRIDMAGLRWERTPALESVTLTSPLGTTVARVWKEAGGEARLKSPDREATASDLESLIEEALGTPVPLASLRWWIQGLEAQPRDGARGAVETTFNHAGWDIQLEAFPLAADVPVARRIVARRGEVMLRLVIDEWEPRK